MTVDSRRSSFVGTSAVRKDGRAKATGRYRYGVDFELPGMLFAKIHRSTHAHARIASIDVSSAASFPGVRAVLTGADVPSARASRYVRDEPILAIDRVRYVGEPIVAIAADDLETAEEACRLVQVDYEPLPVVSSTEEAIAPGAPLIHPDWESYWQAPFLRRNGNVLNHATLRKGDVEAVFEAADHVFVNTYDTQMVHQVSLEGRVAVARTDDDGSVRVWSSHQFPFGLRQDLADILGLPLESIRVTVTGVGGGFGGKLYAGVEPFCVLLAQATGRPVKLQHTREEEMIATSPRMGCKIELETAVTADGRLLARRGRLLYDAGAYSESSPGTVGVGLLTLPGPYRWEALALDSLAVYTNKANCGSYRAPGAPQAVFAGESQIDEIARALDIDPVDFRLRNLVSEADVGPNGQVMNNVSARETLQAAAEAIGWGNESEPNRGKGVACCWWTTTGGLSSARIRIGSDGRIVLVTGATEIGTAAVQAGLAQILADGLGVTPDELEIESSDTGTTPYDFGAQGSRTLFQNGNAVLGAVADLKEKILPLASDKLGVEVSDLQLADGSVVASDDPTLSVSLADLAALAGGVLEGEGEYTAPATPFDPETLAGVMLTAFNSPSFAAHAAEVEVDPETGTPRVVRYVAAHDVGYVVNPTYAAGQVSGGVVQGIGQAMFEELAYRDGAVANPNFTDYKLPTLVDVPDVEVILVERPSQLGPYGMKGVGEPGIIPPGATIANAVANAAARVRGLPITAEKILDALTREA